jgi:hypothetical protein
MIGQAVKLTWGLCEQAWVAGPQYFFARLKCVGASPGARNLLQVQTKVLNDRLRETFVRWYPKPKRHSHRPLFVLEERSQGVRSVPPDGP